MRTSPAWCRETLERAREAVDLAYLFVEGLAALADEGSIPDNGSPMRSVGEQLFQASMDMESVTLTMMADEAARRERDERRGELDQAATEAASVGES